ncbi:MAG: glutathione synthase [Rhodospirillales bacterium]|nr:glutathione synthase [Rhodospirillales bacterium]
MALTVAIQMDPIAGIDIDADSTFVLALEAQKRGHRLFYYLPTDLTLDGERISAKAHPLEVRREAGNHFTLGEAVDLDLANGTDVVLLRQDPPFDLAYITTTHILERIHPKTLVVNDPAEVRNAPEKILMLEFPHLLPPTLISRDRDRIAAFRAAHQDIIVKPLYGNGGAGVFHVTPEDENLNALLEMFEGISREPIMVQRYIPEVRQGDKRIILVNGEAAGVILRVPQAGEARSNMHVGGRATKDVLNERDREICAAIGPTLKEKGLIFVGIDVIGDYLTEINVTSPTGIQEINRFDGSCLEAQIWDAIELRLSAAKK